MGAILSALQSEIYVLWNAEYSDYFYCCTVHVVIITVFIVAPCMLL